MKELIWKLDVYAYAYLKVFTGPGLQSLSRLTGELFLYFPFFAFLFVFLVAEKKTGWFQELLFNVSAGIMSFQLSAFLALWLNRPSPLALEHRIAGMEGILPIKDAFAFPDWASASFLALVVFFFFRAGSTPRLIRYLAVFTILLFVFSRVNGAYAFFSDVLAGALIGSLIGFLFAKLLTRVEKLAVS